MKRTNKFKMTVIKWTRYEFWPFWLFYFPMYFYGIYLALRAGSATYFTAVNPSMKYGGAFDMSKSATLSNIPDAFKPRTVLLSVGNTVNDAEELMRKAGLSYPVIAKPDVGEYLSAHHFDTIIKEFIDWDLELGILYYRMPGRISFLMERVCYSNQ